MSLRHTLLLALALVLLTAGSQAQSTPPLVTDRPDQTESTSIVPVGFAQLEVGGVFSGSKVQGDEVETLTLAPALLRIGIFDRLEARIGFAGWVQTRVTAMGSSSTSSGVGSPDLGLKFRIVEGYRRMPSVALLANVVLPVGSDGVRAERADPGVRLALAQVISDRINIGYNVGARAVSVDEGGDVSTTAEGLYTISFAISLSEKLGAFVEGFGTLGITDDASSSHLVDTGLTALLLENVQFDLSAGVRYAGKADDWFVGAGVSLRVPR